jgi:hypothetical protein
MYLADIIHNNLAKNNIVIEVVRNLIENDVVHPNTASAASANHLIKHHYNASAPLFFPRVDECYYIPHSSHTTYETMCEVRCVMDLWTNHKEMTLYVIRIPAVLHSPELVITTLNEEYGESGTEGFDSDNETNAHAASITLDYCKIIEEYYHSKFSKVEMLMGRKLVVLF